MELSETIVLTGGTGEIIEKKSRFIANVGAVSSEEEALAFIADMKKKYWDARHNCMAYIVNGIKRFSDDGEPSGTAGKPILDVIEGRGLTNAVIVVTRYFGGVLLGTGGLVRAYQKSAIAGLEDSIVAEKCEGISTFIDTDYNGFGKIQYIAGTEGVNIIETDYQEKVRLRVVCETEKYGSFEKKVIEATAGRADICDREPVQFYKTEAGVELI